MPLLLYYSIHIGLVTQNLLLMARRGQRVMQLLQKAVAVAEVEVEVVAEEEAQQQQ